MALAKLTKCSGAAGIIRARLLCSLAVGGALLALDAPARAQEQLYQTGLLNRFFNPGDRAAAEKEDAQPPKPMRGLINRMLDPDDNTQAAPPAQAAQPPAQTPVAANVTPENQKKIKTKAKVSPKPPAPAPVAPPPG